MEQKNSTKTPKKREMFLRSNSSLSKKSNNEGNRWDGDKVVLSKIVLSNFCPKQANKWIGDPRGSIIDFVLLS
jgi:hypothetical protein